MGRVGPFPASRNLSNPLTMICVYGALRVDRWARLESPGFWIILLNWSHMYEPLQRIHNYGRGRTYIMYIYIFYSRVRSFGSLSIVGARSFLRSSRSFPLLLRSSFSSWRSSSRYSRSGILKPPCRNKTGLWSTRASARLVAFQKYNVSTVCLTLRIYIHLSRLWCAGCISKIFLLRLRRSDR